MTIKAKSNRTELDSNNKDIRKSWKNQQEKQRKQILQKQSFRMSHDIRTPINEIGDWWKSVIITKIIW